MLTLVVGGFFGDEGKGKIAAYLALAGKYNIAVRTGSINAGHTVVFNGNVFKLRCVSAGFVNKNTMLAIPPGALIRLDVFFKELRDLGVGDRVIVDYNTGVIEERHVEQERQDRGLISIGSTLQGVGSAMSDRVLRKLRLAKDFDELKPFLKDVSLYINEELDKGNKVLVEGTQGTFLSLYHGTYPFVTSRDTTASALLSEIGVGPKRVSEIIVVFKSYVTRVGEGPLHNEYTREEIERLGLIEHGTVSGRPRRVAPFNIELAKRAIMLNSASQIAITKLDALFKEARGIREWSKLPQTARRWIEDIENELKTPISLIGTGEEIWDIVDRTKDLGVEI